MNDKLPRIFADFQNADSEGFLRLNCVGTTLDLSRLGIVLHQGLFIEVASDEFWTKAEVFEPGEEGVWRAKIDWGDIQVDERFNDIKKGV